MTAQSAHRWPQVRSLINAVDYKIKEFIEEWEDGSSEIFELYLSEIKRFEPLNDEEIFQIISNIKHIEEIEVGDDCNVFITINKATLVACYEAQLQEWKEESDIKNFGRYEPF